MSMAGGETRMRLTHDHVIASHLPLYVDATGENFCIALPSGQLVRVNPDAVRPAVDPVPADPPTPPQQ